MTSPGSLATGDSDDRSTRPRVKPPTGVTNPLPRFAASCAKYPDVALIVDTVSSFSGVKIDMDALGDRRNLRSAKSTRAAAGLFVASVSEKAFERADKVANRGSTSISLEFKSSRRNGGRQARRASDTFTRSNSRRTKFSRKASRRVTLVTHGPTCSCSDRGAALDSISFARKVPHQDAHLREKQ